jgi:hypothetical protein
LAPADFDKPLRIAIEERRIVRLRYRGKERIVEPHDYGIHKGKAKLLAYQIAGESSGRLPNWRWMDCEAIWGIHVLDQRFAGGRGASTEKHHEWDELFARVKPASGSSDFESPSGKLNK